MLILWAPEQDARERVLAALDGVEDLRVAPSRERFRRAFGEGVCGVVAAPEPRPELFGHLQALRDREAGGTLVLVLRRSPRILRRLKDVIAEEVVWMDRLSDLPAAVRGAETERRLQKLGRRVREADHLPDTLVAAIGQSLRSRPPLTSVQELAGELDRDRRTLWHHWRSAMDDGQTDLTLKGFLDWVLLLRATAMKSGSRSWHDVAGELGVHARTLRRVAQRRTGASLRDLSPGSGELDDRFEAFRDEAVAPLLAASDNGDADAS